MTEQQGIEVAAEPAVRGDGGGRGVAGPPLPAPPARPRRVRVADHGDPPQPRQAQVVPAWVGNMQKENLSLKRQLDAAKQKDGPVMEEVKKGAVHAKTFAAGFLFTLCCGVDPTISAAVGIALLVIVAAWKMYNKPNEQSTTPELPTRQPTR